MASTGKIVVRIVFVVCMVLILLSDYTGLFGKIVGENRAESAVSGPSRIPPRPTNPGYGDVKNEIDLDADIEDDSIKNFGKTIIIITITIIIIKTSELIATHLRLRTRLFIFYEM